MHILERGVWYTYTMEDEWTRKHVLRDWRFYGIVAIAMLSPFVGTVIFFYQRNPIFFYPAY